MRKRFSNILLTSAAFLAVQSSHALAQGSADWVQPGTDLFSDLEAGLVQIGSLVIGIAVIVTGLVMSFSDRPNWMRIGIIILAGLLITVGPSTARTLLGI